MKSTEAFWRLTTLGQPVVRTAEASAALGLTTSATSHQLRALAEADLIQHLSHGRWAIAPRIDPLVVASWITHPDPSYVSFYTALRLHGVIQQVSQVIFVASTAKTTTTRTATGVYSVHQVAPALFGGFAEDRGRRIATAEKAIFDTLYLRRARSGRFRGLTEVDLPLGFSWDVVRSWVARIGDVRLRSQVADAVENLARLGVPA